MNEDNVPDEDWAQPTIDKIEEVYSDRHEPHDSFLSGIVFWSSIFVIVIANVLTSVTLIPFFTVLDSWFLDIVIITIALVMGFLYNLLLTDIAHLDRKHHMSAAVVIPFIALVNVGVMVLASNELKEALSIQSASANPFLIGLMYALFFVTPYLVSSMKEGKI